MAIFIFFFTTKERVASHKHYHCYVLDAHLKLGLKQDCGEFICVLYDYVCY